MIAEKGPLVMCLTNTVAANFTANCLLAVGAKPAMIEEPEEAAELASVANAVLVNVGTVTARQADVMRAAIASCNAHGVPWALDPVAADKIGFRRRLVLEFLAQKPAQAITSSSTSWLLTPSTPSGPRRLPSAWLLRSGRK